MVARWNLIPVGIVATIASLLTIAPDAWSLERDASTLDSEETRARGCTETVSDPHRLRVRLIQPPGLDDALLAQVRAEIESIWRRYQIEIVWEGYWSAESGATKPDLWVQFVNVLPPTNNPSAVAWIPFHHGQPMPFARVSMPAALKLLETKAWFEDRSLRDATPKMRDLALARILGRTLAHEIGHFLLASPVHAKQGLMRASIDPDRLVYPGLSWFSLESGEVRALRAARLASCELAARATPTTDPR